MGEVTEKTLYDGRLLTHQRLNSGWNVYSNHMLEKDFDGVLTALQVILVESSSALSKDSEINYIKRLEVINRKIDMLGNGSKVNPNSVNVFNIKKDLLQWCLDIRRETKHLYLPFELIDTDPEELFKKIEKQMG